jgi:hypothetical protein
MIFQNKTFNNRYIKFLIWIQVIIWRFIKLTILILNWPKNIHIINVIPNGIELKIKVIDMN